MHKGNWLFWSGVRENERAANEIDLIVSENCLKNIREKYLNARILAMEVKTRAKDICTIVMTYGEDEDEERRRKTNILKNYRKK